MKDWDKYPEYSEKKIEHGHYTTAERLEYYPHIAPPAAALKTPAAHTI